MSAPSPLAELLAPLLEDPARSAVLLDVDGTLAPIVRDPEAATVPERMRRAVHALTERYGLVGCVSGRRAAMARRMLGIGSIPYAGNHGAELLLRGDAEPRVDPEAARWAARVHEVLGQADPEELREAGVRAEDKGLIAALHWRGADDEAAAEALARRIAQRGETLGLSVHEGRKVLELRPPLTIGKDVAVRGLLAAGPPDIDVALYVGDDRTDADAFAGLRTLAEEGRLRRAICLGVRSDETPPEIEHGADALVDGTDGVRALLETLVR